MRVLVATDTIGSLSSARAGRLLASGWPEADVIVVSLGEAGSGFAAAAAHQLGADLSSAVLGDKVVSSAAVGGTTLLCIESTSPMGEPPALSASSADLGSAVRQALEPGTNRLLIDLSGASAHDGGAGFLAALGAEADVALDQGVSGLAGLTRLDLTGPRALLAEVDVVGVVPSDQLSLPLLGLRGITSLRGRQLGGDQAQLLDTDATLARWAGMAAPEGAATPGAGACGGLGFAVLALGGRLTTGPRYAFAHDGAASAVAQTDLVVTGCTVFDFARRGGGVVAEAARVATERLAPCIAVAAEVLISGREMRTMGVESAYAVREASLPRVNGGDVSEAELVAMARRIGRSWRW